jgi:selenoprotein W-related protein
VVISVTYCASCNYLQRALWMAGEILSEIQFQVERFVLVVGDHGVFDWHVDDELVFSKNALGRFPELEELKEAIYRRLDG